MFAENAEPRLFDIAPRLEDQLDIDENLLKDEVEGFEEEPFSNQEIFEHIRDIKDPEHPFSLERVGVVNVKDIEIDDRRGKSDWENWVILTVYFKPTIPHCSMANLIGLSIKIRLLKSLPKFFKIFVKIKPGTHVSEDGINKQLNDKERVSAAQENEYLMKEIKKCLKCT